MVTTMALVWSVNSTLSWRCNYVMQWNLISFYFISQLLKPAVLMNPSCNTNASRQKRPNFRIPYFAPPNGAPFTVLPGANAPFAPPSHRH